MVNCVTGSRHVHDVAFLGVKRVILILWCWCPFAGKPVPGHYHDFNFEQGTTTTVMPAPTAVVLVVMQGPGRGRPSSRKPASSEYPLPRQRKCELPLPCCSPCCQTRMDIGDECKSTRIHGPNTIPQHPGIQSEAVPCIHNQNTMQRVKRHNRGAAEVHRILDELTCIVKMTILLQAYETLANSNICCQIETSSCRLELSRWVFPYDCSSGTFRNYIV